MSQDRTPAEEEIAKSLRLRGASPPVARLSRRALVVSGAALSLGLFAALGWSLSERRRPPPPVADPPPASAPSERVTALPRGYVGPAGVPALGPPLPGDLGRPMLAAQREGKHVDWPSGEPAPADPPPITAPQRPVADVERQTRVAARQAARQSGLFAAARPDGRGPPAAPAAADSGAAAPAIDARTTSGERLQAPASPYVLQAGAVIPAALVTGLRSDAPGVAIAQVTQGVHDSLGGGVLLIPAGARLIGEYAAEVKAGDSRLRVAWTRLILPSGRSIVLEKLPAADAQGMAGLQDGVDRHGGRILAAAGLSTLLAIGAESGASSDESDLVRAIRRGGADAVTDVGRQVVGRSLDRIPTLTIRPGAPLRVLLTKDLVLEPYVERTPR
ncbi:TrbI/VirB10 family protein [Caulobacter sp. FWC26]|jgi:type IV secretion system protein VirB10|uniref:TrbI/VirB10 family protein n=1 Tax=Caulobacter sp. FWC26 TaxID=69665 RepID=UPI000C15510E|nr:TrbI/VirB10 family protein [Caulobacter sp. FWC26]AZS21597.1 TrbI/VirB10 family protein [Caulobacter sp. FWC26]